MADLVRYYREELRQVEEAIRQHQVAAHNREGVLEHVAEEVRELHDKIECLSHKATTYKIIIDELSEED